MDEELVRNELLGTLTELRRHVLGTTEGLSDAQLAHSSAPSGWSIATMVKHLAHDIERYWFNGIVGGEPLEVIAEGNGWVLDDGESPSSVIDLYRATITRSDAVLATVSLADAPRQRDPRFAGWVIRDVHEILIHVIQETATHCGHLDIAREQLDGRQWLTV